MTRKSHRYRFPNGTRLVTGDTPSAVPGWAPHATERPPVLSRADAAKALWSQRCSVKRNG